MSVLLTGFQYVTIDSKGRLPMPLACQNTLREADEQNVVLTVNPMNESLFLYPQSRWDPLKRMLEKVEDSDSVKELLLGYEKEADLDGAGRILIPQQHRRYAKFDLDRERRLILVGIHRRWELWREATWEEALDKRRESSVEEIKHNQDIKGLL